MKIAMTSIQSEVRALLENRSEEILAKDIDRLISFYFPDIVYKMDWFDHECVDHLAANAKHGRSGLAFIDGHSDFWHVKFTRWELPQARAHALVKGRKLAGSRDIRTESRRRQWVASRLGAARRDGDRGLAILPRHISGMSAGAQAAVSPLLHGGATTTASTQPIDVGGLYISCGDLRVLDGVDLKVAEGMVFALLGANGAGKTTTVQILYTLIEAEGRTARIHGHDVVHEADAVRKSIGVTGQFSRSIGRAAIT
jgi:ABC-type multidrug transport system fused ATPase/permease subunit